MTEWKSTVPYSSSYQSSIAADGRGEWVADSRLCRSRVAAKVLFLKFRKIFAKFFILCFMKFLILCYAKFSSNFAKLKIILSEFCETQNVDKIILIFAKLEEIFATHEIKNFVKILWNYKNEVSQQPYAGLEWRGGGGPVQPWRILRAN